MSFSSDVKKELCAIECEEDCCKRAEAYGLLYFGRSFGSDDISIMTDYDYIAKRYCDAIDYLIQHKATVTESKSGKYLVSIDDSDARSDILYELGYTGAETTFRLLTNNIENECCFGAFLRGAFLSCGIVTDPKKEYHLELNVIFRNKSNDLTEFIGDFSADSEKKSDFDVEPRQSERNGSQMVYFKDSAYIEELLAVMGAQNSVMEFIGEKVLKDVRNNVNRKVNCDNANIKKTCDAARVQLEAIKRLKKTGKFDELTPQLKELADLRSENPEMTLSELGASLSEPISRSGVNHRLKRLVDLSGI